MYIPISYGWAELIGTGKHPQDIDRAFLEGKYRFWGGLDDLDWTPFWDLQMGPPRRISPGRPLDGHRGRSHKRHFEAICLAYGLKISTRTISPQDIGRKLDREIAARRGEWREE